MERSQFDNYIDGVAKICKVKNPTSEFKRKNINLDDLEVVCKLNYSEMSKRIQDIDFAQAENFELTMKIKVRKIKNINSQFMVIIGNKIHSIKYMDSDSRNLYLYLQGEREIET